MDWVDANKRTPPRQETGSVVVFPYVLCYHPMNDPEYAIAAYDEEADGWFDTYGNPVDVLSWQELPTPPIYYLVEGGDHKVQGG